MRPSARLLLPTLMLCAACSDGGAPEPPEDGGQGASQVLPDGRVVTPDGSAPPDDPADGGERQDASVEDAGVEDAGAAEGDAGEAPSTLFVDPDFPDCETGSVAGARMRGTLDGNALDYEFGFSSYLTAGFFEYYQQFTLDFRPRNLAYGEASRLFGRSFIVPDGQPAGGRGFCIDAGEFGPVPMAEQPTQGALYKFRITKAYAEEDCSGGPVDVDLRGCIYRTIDGFPTNYGERPEGAAACQPLSRRLAGEALEDALMSCDGEGLLGMPNRTHAGNNGAIAMLSPLVAGRAYAANLTTEGAIEAVSELWGQSEPCGPVDELLWQGPIDSVVDKCIAFTPARAHTHLLYVTRRLGEEGYQAYPTALRLCEQGTCSDAPAGQGAAPGVTLKAQPGAYVSPSRGGLDFRDFARLGVDGMLYTMDSDGGHLDDGPLSSAAFYVNNGDHAGAWNCAAGTRTEVDRAMRYDLTGIRRLGACPAPGAAGSARIVWNQTSNTATLTSSLPGISGTELHLSGSCWQQHCDLSMRGPDRVNWQFAADVDGDLGLNTPTLASADFPLHGATVFVSQRDQPISIACATGGRVRRNVDTKTITLDISGLGTLMSCAGGTAATPSERGIFVR